MKTRICVIGAGVIGLSSAVTILDQLAGCVEVTVMADSFSPHTTSDVAHGLIMPHKCGDTPHHLVRKWTSATMDYLLKLNKTHASDAGVLIVSAYMFNTDNPIEASEFKDLYIRWNELTEKEKECIMDGNRYKYGNFLTTLIAEGCVYMPWLMNRFKQLGGKIIKRKVEALNELFKDYDVIINCTALGSKELQNDKDLYPLRGQVIKAQTPWVKHLYIENEGEFSVFPGKKYTTLAGTRAINDWNVKPYDADVDVIKTAVTRLLPSVKDAEIVYHAAGLRPCRSSVRLDAEFVKCDERTIQIINNYGHGGSGYTLHYGCALDVLDLLKKHMLQNKL